MQTRGQRGMGDLLVLLLPGPLVHKHGVSGPGKYAAEHADGPPSVDCLSSWCREQRLL